MSSSSAVISHYKRKMERHPKESDVLLHCLSKLDRVEVNIALLQETGIGRVVNSLKKSEKEEVAERARVLVSKWKDVVAKEDDEEEETDGDRHISPAPEQEQQEEEEEEEESSLKRDDENQAFPSREREQEEEEEHNASECGDEEAPGSSPPSSTPPRSSSSHHKKHKKKKSSSHRESSSSSSSSAHHHHGSSKKSKKETIRASDSFGNALMSITDSGSSPVGAGGGGSSSSATKKKKQREERSDHASSSSKRSESSKRPSESSHKKSSSEGSSSSSSRKSSHGETKRSSESSSSSSKRNHAMEEGSSGSKKSEVPPAASVSIPSDLLPAISPNYKPLPPKKEVNVGPKKYQNDDEALSSLISMSKSSKRTAVFSGIKKSGYFGPVPTLMEMCITVLQENVDDIYECGGLDFITLKPILERASPQTLAQIEEHNQYLMTETGDLWERFCKKNFPKEKRQEMESWREMFERCTIEREEKLNLLKVKVKDSYKKVESSYRQTKLAYVGTVAKPPRSVFRAQAKNGTAIPFGNPLKRSMVNNSSSSNNGASSSRSSSSSSSMASAPKKPKMAPLMSKTLKMARGIKGGFRR